MAAGLLGGSAHQDASTGGLLTGWALFLAVHYRRSLVGYVRSDGAFRDEQRIAPLHERAEVPFRTPDRRRDDRHVAAQWMASATVAVAATGLGAAVDLNVLADTPKWTYCVAFLTAIPFVLYASSLVDHYYIRPRLDGVVREPPCRSSRDRHWCWVTRIWYLHRSVADILGITLVIGAVTALAAAPAELDTASTVAVVSAALAVLIVLARGAVHTLRTYAADEPRLWLGDTVGCPGQPESFLLHVTGRGIVVRDRIATPPLWSRQRDIPHAQLESRDYVAATFRGCALRCLKVNDDCEWPHTRIR